MTRGHLRLVSREELHAEYDRRLNAKIDLIEQQRERDEKLSKPVLLSNGFRRSDALILIAGALCAALVGTLIGIVENGWLL